MALAPMALTVGSVAFAAVMVATASGVLLARVALVEVGVRWLTGLPNEFSEKVLQSAAARSSLHTPPACYNSTII